MLLGVDGGGTKTLAAVCTREGQIVGVGRAGASNYQSVGEAAAAAAIAGAVEEALAQAGRPTIAASALGLAGFDGPVEAAIVERVVSAALGPAERRFVENDSLLVLRAGTVDGVGVGVVAGTGNNCIGRDAAGRRAQIGGMGPVSGDAGSAPDLALRAARAAWLSADGRRPRSALVAAVLEAAEVSAVERLVDRMEDGARFDAAVVPALVTALFAAAGGGDVLARAVIVEVAEEIAGAAAAALAGLHRPDGTVVLGGTVFARHPALGEAVARALAARAPAAKVVRAPGAPVLGALLWAHDLLGLGDAARAAFRGRVLASPGFDG